MCVGQIPLYFKGLLHKCVGSLVQIYKTNRESKFHLEQLEPLAHSVILISIGEANQCPNSKQRRSAFKAAVTMTQVLETTD